MRAFTKFAAAAVLSLTMAGAANATSLIEIGTSGVSGPNQITWDGTGAGQGHLFTTNLATVLNFNDAIFNDGMLGQAAFLTISAFTSPGAILNETNSPIFQQQGLDGYFEFKNASNVVLLRGDFTGMWLNGRLGDTAGTAMTVLSNGTLNLSSAVADLSKVRLDNASFAFTNVHPAYTITNGQLGDFRGNNLTGSFAGVVPEPGTWGLMIMGFGGAGAMLRSRRRTLALTA